jgi:hypothetical protein
MAIEIKELRIKVTVAETAPAPMGDEQKLTPVKLQELRSGIVKECVLKVLEKIKEKAER